MSKTVATFIAVISVVIFLHAFRAMHASNITGNVFSSGGTVWVYAINGKDSLKTMVSNGKFRIPVKPGSWKVLIANSRMLKEDEGMTIDVQEGSTMDLGTIKLN